MMVVSTKTPVSNITDKIMANSQHNNFLKYLQEIESGEINFDNSLPQAKAIRTLLDTRKFIPTFEKFDASCRNTIELAEENMKRMRLEFDDIYRLQNTTERFEEFHESCRNVTRLAEENIKRMRLEFQNIYRLQNTTLSLYHNLH